MDLKQIASVAGRPGLFRVLKPTRVGVVLEPLDGQGGRFAAGPNSRVSVLQEISIYTTTEDGAVPLGDVLRKVHAHQEGKPTELNPKQASEAELRAFMEEVLPDYDAGRVYGSDIKKLITWYNLLVAHQPDLFDAEEEPQEESKTPAEDAEAKDAAPTSTSDTEEDADAAADTDADEEKA